MTINGEEATQRARPDGAGCGSRSWACWCWSPSRPSCLKVYRTGVLVPSRAERPTLVAVYRRTAPIANLQLGSNNYGPGTPITWAQGKTRWRRSKTKLNTPDGSTVRHNPTNSKAAADLSLTVYVVYTDTSLFFAFRRFRPVRPHAGGGRGDALR